MPLTCAKCGRVLASVVDHNGRTAVLLVEADGLAALLTRGEIKCPSPKCGGVVEFESHEVPAKTSP